MLLRTFSNLARAHSVHITTVKRLRVLLESSTPSDAAIREGQELLIRTRPPYQRPAFETTCLASTPATLPVPPAVST